MFIHTISNKQHVAEGSDNNNLPHPWFVTGLTYAEGTFMLGFNKSNDYRMGYPNYSYFFEKKAMHKKDHGLLYSIKRSRKNN